MSCSARNMCDTCSTLRVELSTKCLDHTTFKVGCSARNMCVYVYTQIHIYVYKYTHVSITHVSITRVTRRTLDFESRVVNEMPLNVSMYVCVTKNENLRNAVELFGV